MPYIPQDDRPTFDPHVDALVKELDALPEDKMVVCWNYCSSRLTWGLCGHGAGRRKYVRMNGVVGALMCAMLELNRRQIAPYEDEKIESAGDVGKPDVS